MARLQFHRDLIKYLISSIFFFLMTFFFSSTNGKDKNFLHHAGYLRSWSEFILFFSNFFFPFLLLPLECIRIIYEDILLPFIFHAIFFCLCPLNKHHPSNLPYSFTLCTFHIILCVYFFASLNMKQVRKIFSFFFVCLDFKGREMERKVICKWVLWFWWAFSLGLEELVLITWNLYYSEIGF